MKDRRYPLDSAKQLKFDFTPIPWLSITNACQRNQDIDKITTRGAFKKTTIKDTVTNSNWHTSKTNLREGNKCLLEKRTVLEGCLRLQENSRSDLA
jgi:hypothetical protein